MRKLLKSFKTEINPTEEQKAKIRKTIGTCRYIYNFYLAHNKELYNKGEKFMSSNRFRVWLNNEYLSEHPEIMEELEQKIRAHYHIGAEGDVEENEEAATAEGITKEEE